MIGYRENFAAFSTTLKHRHSMTPIRFLGKLYGNDPLNSRNHPAFPPSGLLPREAGARDPRHDYFNAAPSGAWRLRPVRYRRAVFAGISDIVATALRDAIVRSAARRAFAATGEQGSTCPTADASTRDRRERIRGGALPVPFLPPAPIPHLGRPATFDERFPASAPAAGAPSGATRPTSPFSGQPMRTCRRRSLAFRTIPMFRRRISMTGLPA
ncbi:hypothetical protein FBZ93_107118 [Bradyrhizobium macuxiense]|uniref:Uncharacterized protein n=1 Tax=Bradyrhizobium macuxiense TaxID=1755647 RepID=A0A560LNM2_9BRAD|nr:hypothetical protein FBZ93_107118 [Bradyrhizobium macuxiense]